MPSTGYTMGQTNQKSSLGPNVHVYVGGYKYNIKSVYLPIRKKSIATIYNVYIRTAQAYAVLFCVRIFM